MAQGDFDTSDVAHLATELDAVQLDERDRATLHAVFALAGKAVEHEGEDEVSGFSFPVVPTSLFDSFQLGGTTGGGTIRLTKSIGGASPQLLDAHWKNESFNP